MKKREIINSQGPSGQTPRCLRRADSGMPNEDLTPRSDSISTEDSSPPDAPGSNHSESSSGVHSNESSENNHFNSQQQSRRSTSVADLTHPAKEDVQWKSCSLQRNVQLPSNENYAQNVPTIHANPCFAQSPSSQSVYGYIGQPYARSPKNGEDHSVPAVILESTDSTVVIRRKVIRPKTNETTSIPIIKEEPFGRATNIRMTTFTESGDLNVQASSATLPHYPTQTITASQIYPQCSTMPLPQHTSGNIPSNLTGGNSCNVYPRQHSTIPTHHNGVRLFNGTPNPCIKRLQYNQNGSVRLNHKEPIYTGINRNSGEIYHYNS